MGLFVALAAIYWLFGSKCCYGLRHIRLVKSVENAFSRADISPFIRPFTIVYINVTWAYDAPHSV